MRLNQRINHGEIVGYYPVLRDMCELGRGIRSIIHTPPLLCYTLVSVRVFYTHLQTVYTHSTLLHTFMGKS